VNSKEETLKALSGFHPKIRTQVSGIQIRIQEAIYGTIQQKLKALSGEL
jgi:hypothetical protein